VTRKPRCGLPAHVLHNASLGQRDFCWQLCLDHLHVLANYEWDSRALLSLVLGGLPEFNRGMRLH